MGASIPLLTKLLEYRIADGLTLGLNVLAGLGGVTLSCSAAYACIAALASAWQSPTQGLSSAPMAVEEMACGLADAAS